MKYKTDSALVSIKIFLVKMLCYYLALLTWIAIILMCASVILIPLFVHLKLETSWFDKPFKEAYGLGDEYYWKATYKFLERWKTNETKDR